MNVTIDHHNYYYKEAGAGDIILFIHGNPDSANYWDGVVSYLYKDYRCICPDLPGFGRSDLPEGFNFSLEYGAQWVQSFLEKINVQTPVHLVVHDIGGFYGLPWAIKYPDKVRSICVHNSIFFSSFKWHIWGRIWRTRGLGELTKYLNSKWLYRWNLRKTSPKLSDAYLDESYKLGIANDKTVAVVLNVYRAMDPEVFIGWEDEYHALTQQKPTIVIWADNDPYIPPKMSVAERFANGHTIYRIPKGGHWAAAEYPELFAHHWREGLGTKSS